MKKNLKTYITILSVVLAFNILSCSSKDSGVTDGPSVGTPPPAPPPPTPPDDEEVNEEELSMAPVSDNFDYYTSRDGVFGNSCSIPSGEINQHIECLFDVQEQDLTFYGFDIKINIPTDNCYYASFSSYWHYHQEVGVGPESIELEVSINKEGTVTELKCSVDGSDPPSTDCTIFPELEINRDDQEIKCVYDRSEDTENNGANCCFGEYSLTKTIIQETDDGQKRSTTSDTLYWNGDMRACIGGAAHAGGPPFKMATLLPTSMMCLRAISAKPTLILQTSAPPIYA